VNPVIAAKRLKDQFPLNIMCFVQHLATDESALRKSPWYRTTGCIEDLFYYIVIAQMTANALNSPQYKSN
jgi:hypothetical protein